jgi:hypothetical protein
MPYYVNEASTLTVQARFYDQANDPMIPASARYLIRDITNNRVVRDWTELSPTAATMDIEVAASDNDLYDRARPNRRFEKRVVTVQGNVGMSSQRTNEIEYWVRDLAGVENG